MGVAHFSLKFWPSREIQLLLHSMGFPVRACKYDCQTVEEATSHAGEAAASHRQEPDGGEGDH